MMARNFMSTSASNFASTMLMSSINNHFHCRICFLALVSHSRFVCCVGVFVLAVIGQILQALCSVSPPKSCAVTACRVVIWYSVPIVHPHTFAKRFLHRRSISDLPVPGSPCTNQMRGLRKVTPATSSVRSAHRRSQILRRTSSCPGVAACVLSGPSRHCSVANHCCIP